ncbi:MAG: hypothetical protein JSW50_02635 [Candidatus Latescibacterota bacterium]|nr:MAG: hypothetical protein JSW50_02635 [Candidatus Latescibacterota bacterium]
MSYRAFVVIGVAAVAVIVGMPVPAAAASQVLVRLEDMDAGDVEMGGFVLDTGGEVSIEAVGFRARGRGDDLRFSSAWILNSETRKVAWHLKQADSEKLSKHLIEYTAETKLPKGRYEVYYSTYPSFWSHSDIDIEGVGDFISNILENAFDKGVDYDEYRAVAEDFYIEIRGEGQPLGSQQVRDFQKTLGKNAVVSIAALGNDHYETVGLQLEKPMDLQIYAIGEIREGGSYDYCWITDVDSYRKVWRFEFRNSVHAGGAKKNRMFKGAVKLRAGSYALYCVTDDSHAFGKWNAAPPHDPYFWGVTVQTADPKMARYVQVVPYEHLGEGNAIVELTRLGDDETASQGFTLDTRMQLRVFALGEGGDDEMYDYSWIADAHTRGRVWEMRPAMTEHAGGASKNRVFDGVITLDAGDYIVYAITDGSHSYEHWNASAPHDPERWGITVLVGESDRAGVGTYSEDNDPSILAKITAVGNGKHKMADFDIESNSTVRIYAIGEGGRGEMHDYAWIENRETGRTVWEMTYRMTDHAGGAQKNRMFNDTIALEAGQYAVHYRTDDSHSFSRWNASPPHDPAAWGVTVKLVKD